MARFLILEKGVTDVEMERTRMNPVVLDCSWVYLCELLVLNVHRHRNNW